MTDDAQMQKAAEVGRALAEMVDPYFEGRPELRSGPFSYVVTRLCGITWFTVLIDSDELCTVNASDAGLDLNEDGVLDWSRWLQEGPTDGS